VITEPDQRLALDIAYTAVVVPLRGEPRWLPEPQELTGGLSVTGACFVTLRRDEALLGCIGSLVACRVLGVDVAHNAAAAAFDDPRLPAVTVLDAQRMDVHISVLSPLTPLPAQSWDELRASVHVGVDGLLIEADRHRATFLPAVWEMLPDSAPFLDALWSKAGLPPRAWACGLRAWRYRATEFGAPAAALTARA